MRLTGDGAVIAIATPGHTANHVSVMVQIGDTSILLAGDTSYNEHLMLAGRVDGVSPDDDISGATLNRIRRFAQARETVYLPTHDPQSAMRLDTLQLVDAATMPERSGGG